MKTGRWIVVLLPLLACGREPQPEGAAQQPPPVVAGEPAPAAVPMSVSADVAEQIDGEAHRTEVEEWAARRVERLTREDGWLAVVGLHWLTPGESTLGSAPDSTVVLPAHLPARVGMLRLAGEGEQATLELELAPGVEATHDGVRVERTVLASDVAGGKPTEIQVGSVRFYPIARRGRLALRVKDAAAPARAAFHGIERYPVDLAWRVVARFEAYDPPREIAVPSVLGGADPMLAPGALVFTLGGEEHRLDAVDEETTTGDDDLFVIFGDATNGDTTYGGGRFLYVAPPDASGRVVVDFNRAYNPPCVFTAYATCPLPPPQNRLPARVEAGEKRYAGH